MLSHALRPLLYVALSPLVATVLAACSPVFNWREVRVDGALTALLPCKPDRADRTLPAGSERLPMQMVGCEAGGATFAVAWLPSADAADAARRATLWRAAIQRQWAHARRSEQPVAMQGAAEADPGAVDIQVQAPEAAGSGRATAPFLARMRFFAHADEPGRRTIYQAIVLGQPSSEEAIPMFFDGLRLR